MNIDAVTPKYFDVDRFIADLSDYMSRQKLTPMSLAMLTDIRRDVVEKILDDKSLAGIQFITMLMLCAYTDLNLKEYIR